MSFKRIEEGLFIKTPLPRFKYASKGAVYIFLDEGKPMSPKEVTDKLNQFHRLNLEVDVVIDILEEV